ncbi:MAG TPA: radical SAM protein [Candidatus Hydrogenedentes bacterium]|nr:radical SAM protein [Candidatus Hydrogenedentota bacterium]HOV74035.1 radical SAM protein [Candidatus Hydrogenedentota bacterium]HPC15979.1 radical SAM protein [Candidatus Hydrogenedentota bacterium]HRT19933.1 radical SAM protein [Candidatus Hydrogenedentota bacterium]HRT64611.1 radical SAM protein [Candidatus Hydrogenedentota bacterium]
MTKHKYRHIFGPVLSRRLGRSLGVDLMPFKTCTYDCVYCEQGRTTDHTACRKEYVPADEILDELGKYLVEHAAPDYITLSGAGEPTLHARLGYIVSRIKSLTKVPLAVITNGSLLWDRPVRDALHEADVVLPSLDAGNAQLFEYIDRPVTGISFEQMVTGLIAFRQSFSNAIWLEVMLMAGVTSGDSEVREMAEWARRIRPDRIQLNTVVRPPSEPFALPVPREQLAQLAILFEPHAEVIADYRGAAPKADAAPDALRVLDLIVRRPCSLQEIAASLGLRQIETIKLVEGLIGQGKIVQRRFASGVFFEYVHDANEEVIS